MGVIRFIFNAVLGLLIAVLAFFSVWRWLPSTKSRGAQRKQRRRQRRQDRRLARKAAKTA